MTPSNHSPRLRFLSHGENPSVSLWRNRGWISLARSASRRRSKRMNRPTMAAQTTAPAASHSGWAKWSEVSSMVRLGKPPESGLAQDQFQQEQAEPRREEPQVELVILLVFLE